MSDTRLSRLDALRFLRRVVEQQAQDQLARIDRWIAQEEQRGAERRRGEERRPAPPEWLLELGIGQGPPPYVHAGGCHMVGGRTRAVTRGQALEARAQGVEACPHCSVDRTLGYLEG